MEIPISDLIYDTSKPWWLDTDSILLSKENWEKLLYYTRGTKRIYISVETLYSIVGLEVVFFPMSIPNNISKFKVLYELYSTEKFKTKSKLWKI